MMLQYWPAARLVWNVRDRLLLSLLMTTKPRSPRRKAIWLLPLSHQSEVSQLASVALRNETMLPIGRNRCSHTQPPTDWLKHAGCETPPSQGPREAPVAATHGGPWLGAEAVPLLHAQSAR